MALWPGIKTWAAVVVSVLDLQTYISDAMAALHGNVISTSTNLAVAASDGDNVLVLVDATSADRTVTLPAIAGAAGRRCTVMKVDSSSHKVIIDPNASELVNLAATYTLVGQFESAQFDVDAATGWYVTSQSNKVLQIINAAYSTQTDSSSSTYADTGLTASITPRSAVSKILVIVHQSGVRKTSNTQVGLKLLRGASLVAQFEFQAGFTNTTLEQNVSAGCCVLDSPASTSALTYKTQFNSGGNIATATVQEGNCTSSITLMEVMTP